MIVTIDGPAGTGKSTVARALAKKLGFQFLDTGAMYRMIALRTLSEDIDLDERSVIIELTSRTHMDLVDGGYLLNGENVKDRIRSAEVTRAASFIAQIPEVREQLVRRQRDIAAARDIVCEGRDQGTVAFPHAECKFFLTAQPEERVRRRQAELESQGRHVAFDELFREQTARDQRDEERAIAPLRPAPDAILVDTTALDAEAVIALLQREILQRRQAAAMQQ